MRITEASQAKEGQKLVWTYTNPKIGSTVTTGVCKLRRHFGKVRPVFELASGVRSSIEYLLHCPHGVLTVDGNFADEA